MTGTGYRVGQSYGVLQWQFERSATLDSTLDHLPLPRAPGNVPADVLEHDAATDGVHATAQVRLAERDVAALRLEVDRTGETAEVQAARGRRALDRARDTFDPDGATRGG